MNKKQRSLRDVSKALSTATEILEEIERRSLNENELSFEQKVIAAVRGMDNDDPLKDFLSSEEIEEAIKILADVYTVTGVTMPEDWF